MKIKLFIFPDAMDRKVKFVAAGTLSAARKFNAESRVPTREELEAAVAELAYVPLVDKRGGAKPSRPAGAGDFVGISRLVTT